MAARPGLGHDGNSDPVGIVSMVDYVLQRNNADASRVYVTGASSGAMMTNVLLGDYPNVFRAGAAFMGVPFGCFATRWSATYSPTSGTVRAADVSYNGTLAPGAATTIGYQANHSGDSGPPSQFRLNGSTCSVA